MLEPTLVVTAWPAVTVIERERARAREREEQQNKVGRLRFIAGQD